MNPPEKYNKKEDELDEEDANEIEVEDANEMEVEDDTNESNKYEVIPQTQYYSPKLDVKNKFNELDG
eukprot:CAMPEP_0116976290 /NCGR_PEP_ID=MMETSP0467-20121206/56382_1 /TAXON_ID=283647 /ORGANISM="Mesodinium pulex, Strain SPMC105" /LENGTH=66 /DNA_ID=CAMNT_0004669009 /DNA_START=287 /DNA_END=486 /DNA_ORIENTATION=-